MAKVWERLDCGGQDLLLALALADFADDDGGNVFPSVETLAAKTRQSARTVQRQLSEFRRVTWLLVEVPESLAGGRGRSVRYRINPTWLKGDSLSWFADRKGDSILSCFESEKGDNHDRKGCQPEQERVTNSTGKGDRAVSPDPSRTTIDPSIEPPERATQLSTAHTVERRSLTPAQVREAFELVQAAYPAGTYRGNAWIHAERNFGRLIDDGFASAAELVEAATAYRDQQQANGNVGTRYILSPANFYDPRQDHWRGPFPKPRSKAQVQQDANVEASQEWLRRGEAVADG